MEWSYVELRRQMIEAVKMSWRMPGCGLGGSSFATDGPWYLMSAKTRAAAAVGDRFGAYADFESARQEIEDQAVKDMRNSSRTVPLTTEEVDWMNERLGWLEMVPEKDRRIVVVTLCHMAGASGRISWKRIRQTLNKNRHWRTVAISDRGLGARFSRALAALCSQLNARKISAAA